MSVDSDGERNSDFGIYDYRDQKFIAVGRYISKDNTLIMDEEVIVYIINMLNCLPVYIVYVYRVATSWQKLRNNK